MNGNGVNTLEYAEELKKAGVPDAQAFAQARLLYEIIGSSLATKRDIADVQKDIKGLDVKIETIKAELKRDIEATKAELKRDIEANKAELKREIEVNKAELKRDIKELDGKIVLRMTAASAGVVLTILSCLVTLGKLGLLTPTPAP